MRFMVMHKMTEEMEKGLPPDPAVLEGVGKLVEEAIKDKVFLGGEGLKPSSERVHVAYENGKRTVTKGPFPDAKQLPAGFGIFRVGSQEEAIAWCDKFAAAIGHDMELFMGPIVEAWDLGMEPKPKDAPLRFLSMHQANASSEADAPPSPQLIERMGGLMAEMTKAGVLQETGGLASSKHGARIRFEGGKHTVLDGPFAESKEMVAGYAIMDLPSKAAAIDWAIRFGEVVKVKEVDVRLMPEW